MLSFSLLLVVLLILQFVHRAVFFSLIVEKEQYEEGMFLLILSFVVAVFVVCHKRIQLIQKKSRTMLSSDGELVVEFFADTN